MNSYNEILEAANNSFAAYESAKEGWSEALDREDEWSAKTGLFSNTSSLDKQFRNAIYSYNSLVKRDLSYKFYPEKYRQGICEDIDKAFDRQLNEISSLRDSEAILR